MTECPRPYVYAITSLLTKATQNVHASRLKFYADSSLNVTEELLEHIGTQGLTFDVEAIVGYRVKGDGAIELQVRWVGFAAEEQTWEPLNAIARDVPAIAMAYVDSLPVAEADLLTRSEPLLRGEGAV